MIRNRYVALCMTGLLTFGSAVGLAGCGSYEKVETLSESGASEETGTEETKAVLEAQTSEKETEMTQAKLPEFDSVDETVYVVTEDGGTVNVRSSCNKLNNSNVIASLDTGTELKRTGVSKEWSRIVLEGEAAYIASDFLSTEKPDPSIYSNSASFAEGEVKLDPSWQYADFSKINSGAAVLYRSQADSRKGKTICVNAGHGTQGGSSVKTLCHPDGTPKVTGGTTSAGATSAVAVSGGMTFADGTPEYKVTVALARILKDKLLAKGYDVLMIREGDDVQLDNVARTVIANNASDCHIALHWDSTESDKGAFYMSVPSNESYRNMEPVKSHWQEHNALGESLIAGLKSVGVKIFSSGSMEMDLTQTSFSTVPSIDIELGDKVSDHSEGTLNNLADGLAVGVDQFFGF